MDRNKLIKLYGDVEKLAKCPEVPADVREGLEECLEDMAEFLWKEPPPTLSDTLVLTPEQERVRAGAQAKWERMMKMSFNTGRAYTADGQVIIAEVSSGRVWFSDISRMIAASFRALPGHAYTEADIRSDVMYHYDRNLCRYEAIPERGEARPLDWQGNRMPAEREHSDGAKEPQRLSHIPDWRDLQ